MDLPLEFDICCFTVCHKICGIFPAMHEMPFPPTSVVKVFQLLSICYIILIFHHGIIVDYYIMRVILSFHIYVCAHTHISVHLWIFFSMKSVHFLFPFFYCIVALFLLICWDLLEGGFLFHTLHIQVIGNHLMFLSHSEPFLLIH